MISHSHLIQSYTSFYIPSDILDVVDEILSKTYRLDEVFRDKCGECEYTGTIQFHLISGFGSPIASISAHYCDGDLEDVTVSDIYDNSELITFRESMIDIIQPLIMDEIFNAK